MPAHRRPRTAAAFFLLLVLATPGSAESHATAALSWIKSSALLRPDDDGRLANETGPGDNPGEAVLDLLHTKHEFILGGATRGILTSMTVPTLLSH
ncbi:MAG TPA: hypothetical protein VKE26_05515 [Xanthobacteraceae bacterium]|nr:hypothetical protein [Xanthobacteraceae bacterium]